MIDHSSVTSQINLWKSEFGEAYTERNAVDGEARLPAFKEVFGDLAIQSALEVGCNKGHNLQSLSTLGVSMLAGVEPNGYAREQAHAIVPEASIVDATADDMPFDDESFDLVFTAGVLIHIAPKDLSAAMHEVHRVSRRYIACLEYYAPQQTEVLYRGHSAALWKTDFGAAYERAFPHLTMIRTGDFSEPGVWDDVRYWLFEK
jgi:pseudaminic acid biosynthesis-associated methylase